MGENLLPMGTNQRWWDLEGEEAAVALFGTLYEIDRNSGSLSNTNLRNLRMYANRDPGDTSINNYAGSGSGDFSGALAIGTSANRPNKANLNVVKSVIDTLVAKIGKNKVKPQFLTTGGTLEQRTKAREMNQFLYGTMDETKSFKLYRLVLRDAFVFGTAFLQTYIDAKGRVAKERIFPDELVVDPSDAYYNNPSTIYKRKFVSKYALIARWPKLKEKIEALKTIDIRFQNVSEPCVLCIEAWRLKRGEYDGRHVIAAKGLMLLDEAYKKSQFPIAKLTYDEPMLGYWGSGIAEELQGLQSEISRTMGHVQECLRLMAYPRIFYAKGTQFDRAKWVNDVGTFVPYSGPTPPTVNVPQAVGSEVFHWMENLYTKSYEIAGVTGLSAGGRKPAGLNSGKALREYNDIESERFAVIQQQFEEFVVEDAYRTLDAIDDSYIVSATSKERGLKKLRWGDIKVEQDNYVLQCFSDSAMPNTPPAKLEYVAEMKNQGFIDPEIAAELLDFPDTEAATRLRSSPYLLILKSLEKCLLDGEYVGPEPFMPPDLALRLSQQMYCYAKLHEFPEDRKNLILQWIDDCLILQARAAPQLPQTAAQSIQEAQLGAPMGPQASNAGLFTGQPI